MDGSCCGGYGRSGGCGSDGELLLHLDVAGLGPGLVVVQNELHCHEIFAKGIERSIVVGDCPVLRLAGTHSHAGTVDVVAFGYFHAVAGEAPTDVIVAEIGEVVFVEHFDPAFGHVNGLDADILMHFLYFGILGLRSEVREKDSVHAEHAVIGGVAEVASVAHVAGSVGCVVPYSLIDPVPDGTAAEEVGRFHGVPVVHEVSEGVAHRVGVFADVEGIFDIHLAFHCILYPGNRGILV